ncbi:MAG: hypothetical protein NT016_03355 [Candidatus Aenigmarchaeota archaeon]|nr:hypothetical protein [Candidatus Aenigmarchaeota archaeon]
MADEGFRTIQSYYSRTDVQKALLEEGRNREIVSVLRDGRFGKRPDMLQYGADIEQAVRDGAASFHGSVERWKQPMQLEAGQTRQQLDTLRAGWDILIDIDIKDFDLAKIFVKHFAAALREHGISSFGLKYTGGKSFHMAVPFEAMPESVDMRPIVLQYPEAMAKVLEYLKWYTTEPLRDALLSFASPAELAERVGKNASDIVSDAGIEPFKLASMDIFSSRHMFRLPYSLHEKSLLVSLPIKIEQLDSFKKEDAAPEKVKTGGTFVNRDVKRREAEALVIEAFDWAATHMKEKLEALPQDRKQPEKLMRFAEPQFPPCVHAILKGVADGKKRSVFILINFLRNMGWTQDEIDRRLSEWNEHNYPPLPANYLRTQLRWHVMQQRNILPPNCDNENFYLSFGVCKPDAVCTAGAKQAGQITIKNPVNYAFRKMRFESRSQPKHDEKKAKGRPRGPKWTRAAQIARP